MSDPAAPLPAGRHDHALRRIAQRKGREKGCSVYIPAEDLQAAGVDPEQQTIYYRTWAGQRGGVFVRLYKAA